MRRDVERRQELDRAEDGAEDYRARARQQAPPAPGFAGTEDRKGGERHRVPPDALRKPEQELRCENDRHRRERECPGALPFVHDQHVSRREQPRHVRDDGHHVQVMVVQQVEPAEGKQHRAEERRRLTEAESPQEPEGSAESNRVAGNQLEIERSPEWKQAVQQLVQRVEHPGLTLAVHVQAGENRWCPQHGVARAQRLLVEIPHRQVKPREVVVDKHAAGEQRTQKRREERDAADRDDAGDGAVVVCRRSIHPEGFRKARISSPRRM